jgi:hypothetical protein
MHIYVTSLVNSITLVQINCFSIIFLSSAYIKHPTVMCFQVYKDIFLNINFVFSLIFILEQHEETA